MLVIRREQMAAFELAARADFGEEMIAHAREFSPRLSEVLGDEQLRVAVEAAMEKADGYGFTNRGPIRLYIEMMFLYGSGFDSDPQYPWAAEILNASGEQMDRAEQLFRNIVDYQQKVSGPNGSNTRRALAGLSDLARRPDAFSSEDFTAGMLADMYRLFPAKADYIGRAGLTLLVDQAREQGGAHGFTKSRQFALLVILKFAFGHGCTSDPLYPWIERTLSDSRIVDPHARAARLENKAITWLEHVLSRPRNGAPK